MGETRGVENGQRYERLVIRNVVVIDGKGTPARGPMDIVIEGNKIKSIRSANRRDNAYQNEEHVLDGKKKICCCYDITGQRIHDTA